MEKVYVENDWYDGPRSGVADFEGKPYRFQANFDDLKGFEDTFKLYPISEEELQLEIEQWCIFVEWNKKYEAGEVGTETHPGHKGINKRYDEIQKLLKNKRKESLGHFVEAKALFEYSEQENRYELTGPCYGVTWKKIETNA